MQLHPSGMSHSTLTSKPLTSLEPITTRLASAHGAAGVPRVVHPSPHEQRSSNGWPKMWSQRPLRVTVQLNRPLIVP